jgi:class 3 adenylate cyclase
MGDALLCVFNAPTRQPDHPLRGARAALRLQAAISRLPNAGARPRFRVGLESGPALVGNIGSTEIRNFLVIGDTTNLAARLQEFASEGSVVMGPGTYERIRDVAVVRSLGVPSLKGKSRPVQVYELLSLQEEPSEASATGPR